MDGEIEMVQGDAAPSRIWNCTREDGSIIDLSLASRVDFIITRPDTGAQTNVNTTACTILTPGSLGKAQYYWNKTDLPVAGVYRCLLRITYTDTSTETKVIYVTVESNSN